ncbi:CC-NBS-LRR resistance protein, partial [Trifolium medium]|nr:CC-NBS-LRR resistance protein [Trifolium medium]
MKSIKNIGTEFFGNGSPLFQPFPLLETLEFDTMLEWKEWKLTGGTSTEFPCLTRLLLRNCPKLNGNIPLGQLGNLKELHIEKMESVKELGAEFYGSSNSTLVQPFLSLETLCFMNMQEWEEWKLIGGTSTEFPSLACLSLHNCPKLKGNIPGNHPSLTSLSLKFCLQLKGMTPNNLSSLRELEISECPLLMESRHSDDKSNIISASPSSDVFSELMISLSSLRKMTLKDIPSLTSFPGDGLPKTLQSLIIWNCEDASQHRLLFLRTVKIMNCGELESVSLGGLPIPNLIHLVVRQCKKLRSLPEPTNTL